MCPVEGPEIRSVLDKQGRVQGERSQKLVGQMDLPLRRQFRTGNKDSRSVHMPAQVNVLVLMKVSRGSAVEGKWGFVSRE